MAVIYRQTPELHCRTKTVLQALICLLVDKMTGTIDSRHVLLVFYCLIYGALLGDVLYDSMINITVADGRLVMMESREV